LLLLGVGGGFACLLGIVVAVFYPQPRPQMPLVVKGLRQLEKWQSLTVPSSSGLPVPSEGGKENTVQLSAEQKKQLQEQVQQLQMEVKTARDRLTALENQLGNPRPNDPLETRLQALAGQLQETLNIPAATQPLFQGGKLQVTLPSDVLFQNGNSLLRREAGLILDKIISDLGTYQGATILIAIHTDNAGNPEDNRGLSFRRANAVEQYLSSSLRDRFRFISVGYGSSRPLVENNSDRHRQRNRRVEISISKE
jgi:outer membrane protein OmpA-like peptidoglycan-associated protein